MSIKLFEQAKYTRGAHYGGNKRAREVFDESVGFLSQLDLYLLLSTAVLTVIGLLMVFSATRSLIPTEPSYYIKRQIVYAVIGFMAMCFFIVVDYRLLQRFTNLLYVLVILSLLAVRAIGHASGFGNAAGSAGAIREIAIGPIAIQPSEFAVLVVILTIAKIVDEHVGAYTRRDIAKMVFIAALPMSLVLIQPDLGTTIIIAVVLFTLLTVAGVRARYLLSGLALAVALFFVFTTLHLLHSYQLSRLTGYLNQDCNLIQNYNLCISKTAIGAGGLRGAGLFQGAFTNNQYVPVQYADFIFSAIGEQLGFLGSIAVLMVFGVLAFRIFRAIGRSADRFGQLICAGVLAFLVFSVFQNVGMTVGLMPITGIPLPFISYGGSALFAFFIAIGLVVNVERNAPGRR